MKHTLHFLSFIIVFCLTSTLVVGQDLLQLENPPESVVGTIDDVLLHSNFGVTNISDQPLDVTVSREELEIVEGTMNYFCWEQCYSPSTNVSPTDLLIQPGQTLPNFYGDYRPMGMAGTSVIRYCFYPTNNPTNRTCTDISFVANNPTGIEEIQNTQGMSGAFPNPATQGYTKIKYTPTVGAGDAHIIMYNVLGSEVKRISLNDRSGEIELNTSDFEAGVYLFSLYENNKLVQSRRLVVGK